MNNTFFFIMNMSLIKLTKRMKYRISNLKTFDNIKQMNTHDTSKCKKTKLTKSMFDLLIIKSK